MYVMRNDFDDDSGLALQNDCSWRLKSYRGLGW
jgi:hypothetical protein